MKRNVGRREFLRGVGLSALGASVVPWLESTPARAEGGTPPLRLVLFYNPNGTVPADWAPREVLTPTDFTLGAIHEPLAPFRDRISLFRGMDNAVALDPNNNGGPHQRGIGALFTGAPLQTGSFADGCGSTAGFADGPSIDQRIAEHIGLETPFRSVELGVLCLESDVQGRIAYSGPARPLPPENSPLQAYRRLFSNLTENPDDRRAAVRGAISETVHAQFRALAPRVSRADRERLDAHEALLVDLERRLGVRGGTGAYCRVPEAPTVLDPMNPATMPETSRAHLDLLAMAFACDLTRVGSVQYSTSFNKVTFPFLDSLGEGHLLSHSGDSNTDAWRAMTIRARWHAEQIAYFLERLATYPEGEGTVLDHTLVLWGNELHKGNSHALRDLPLLTVGSLGGRLRAGRVFDAPGRSHTDLLLTIGRAFGLKDETFGALDYSTGPLGDFLA